MIGQRLGQYEIIDVIGQGGMAIVYRARQVSGDREVAVKVIDKPKLDERQEFVNRFQREVSAIATIDHPHIVKMLDYGEREDIVYLVLQLLDGGTLAKLVRGQRLPLDKVAFYLEQIGSALDYAHQRGLVHRDLKPHNILLDKDANAYLSDFGIAKFVQGETTQVPTERGAFIGTPWYMSPEQWLNQTLDGRADVYALGVMLFEMLTGRVPFLADNLHALIQQHLNEPPPSLLSLNPDLPPGVEPIVEKALAKDRTQRYSTALELVTDFKAKTRDHQPKLTVMPTIRLDASMAETANQKDRKTPTRPKRPEGTRPLPQAAVTQRAKLPTTGSTSSVSAVYLFRPAASGFAWLLIVLFLTGALSTLVMTGFVFTPLNIGLAVLCFPCLFLGIWLPLRSIIIRRPAGQRGLMLRLLVFLLPSLSLIGCWLYAHRA